MDRARKRLTDNLKKLTALNPDLAVMGDQRWVNKCTNRYIVHMCKKIWMSELTVDEMFQVNKAVSGYLYVQRMVESSTPVEPGPRVIKGTVTSLKQRCRNHDLCGKHWYANVRTEDNNTIFTPIPADMVKEDLIGQAIEYFAFVTVSTRDKTFGFAHQTKLMKLKEKSNAS